MPEPAALDRPHEIPGPDKWVRVMADHASDGIWDRDGAGMDLDDLPIENGLRSAFRGWICWYEQDDDSHLPAGHPEKRPFPTEAFAAVGLGLAAALKWALPDWTVIYFDEAKLVPGREQPRSEYEYEISGGRLPQGER